jgi:hypothetical protein
MNNKFARKGKFVIRPSFSNFQIIIMENTTPSTTFLEKYPEFAWLEKMVSWSDNRFKIPVIGARFGLDSFIGAIPYFGDIFGFGMSAILIGVMAKRGVSFSLLFKMLGNIFVDAAAGLIPIIGDIFDISHKANQKNYNLLKGHYEAGLPTISFKKAAGIIAIVTFILFIVLLVLLVKCVGILWSFVTS